MPAQELGIKDDNNIRIIVTNSGAAGIVNSLAQSVSEHSPTSDSVDGSIHSENTINADFKALESIQAALDNIQRGAVSSLNDAAGDAASGFCGTEDSLSSLDNNLLTTGSESHDTTTESGGTVTVPQVFRVNTRTLPDNATSLLGKRPATSVLSHNSILNKVLITSNKTSTSQPQVVPIQIQTVPISQTHGGVQHVQVAPHLSNSPKTPTKTITISQQGIVSPVKGITMAQVAGTPPKLPISKLPISPAKTPTKITMIPVQGRSPQQKMAVSGHTLLGNSVSNVQTTITMSPSKVIKQPGTVHVIQKPLQPALGSASVVTIPASQAGGLVQQAGGGAAPGVRRQVALQPGSSLQQIHVPGNKFHYIRLATPATSTQGARAQLIQPSRTALPSTIVAGQTAPQIKISLPTPSAAQIVNTRPVSTGVQRVILPAAPTQISLRAPASSAPSATQVIRTTLAAAPGTGNLTQIAAGPGGPTFISAGSNAQGVQGYALVPASYLPQIQQQFAVKPAVTSTSSVASGLPSNTATVSQTQSRSSGDYVPIASSNPAVSATTKQSSSSGSTVNGTAVDAGGGARPRKPCNCTKSQCLKLYCDCFANGEFCHNCNCMNCANNLEHEEERSRAIKACLERNPQAFHPKIGKGRAGEKDRRHNKGCNCKRSGCLKNYCECYEAKIMCSSSCKCIGCKNFEESPERKTLMHLADAAEVRVQQQTAAKTKLSSQIQDLPSRPSTQVSGERLPFSFVTSEVVEATCACLLAQAEDAERLKMPPVVQERMVIEEFGRCLVQIIESAKKTKAQDPEDAT